MLNSTRTPPLGSSVKDAVPLTSESRLGVRVTFRLAKPAEVVSLLLVVVAEVEVVSSCPLEKVPPPPQPPSIRSETTRSSTGTVHFVVGILTVWLTMFLRFYPSYR
jgi:hypothetical protein